MGFSDPILTGDGTLIRVAEKSENYVAGVSGWQIDRAGTAEFNNGTFRGSIIVGTTGGRRIEINVVLGSIQMFDSGNAVVADWSSSAGRLIIYKAGTSQTAYVSFDTTFASPGVILQSNTAKYVVAGSVAESDGLGDGGIPTLTLGSGRAAGRSAAVINLSGQSTTAGTTPSAIDLSAAATTVSGNLSVTGIGQRQNVEVAIDQPVTNSTVLVDCTDLVLPVVAGARYKGELVMYYTGPLGNDLDYAWTLPVGTTGKRGTLSPDITSAAGNVIVVNDRVSSNFLNRFSCGGSGGTFRQVREAFTITTTTAGNVQLQFAQRVAAPATSATILSGSNLSMERVA